MGRAITSRRASAALRRGSRWLLDDGKARHPHGAGRVSVADPAILGSCLRIEARELDHAAEPARDDSTTFWAHA